MPNQSSPSQIRFLHLADTHMGYQGHASKTKEYNSLRINKTNGAGTNIRQLDVERTAAEAINLAIAHDVDMILHAGDGLDDVGYKEPRIFNHHLDIATRSGKPYVEIAGNHNLPKKRDAGCTLEALGQYPNVFTVYKGVYEPLRFPELGVTIHCLPSPHTQVELDDQLSSVVPEPDSINIGLGHFGVTSIPFFAEGESKSIAASVAQLKACRMDYFALGDYHTTKNLGNNIWYSGATERFSFGEIANTPKALLVTIDRDTKEVSVEYLPLTPRPMFDFPCIHGALGSVEAINEQITKLLSETDSTGAICRMKVHHLPKHYKEQLHFDYFRELTKEAAAFFIETTSQEESPQSLSLQEEHTLHDMFTNWEMYYQQWAAGNSEEDKEIYQLGKQLLKEAEERMTAP